MHDIPFVVVYLDDILITGPTDEEHLDTLDKVLHRLKSHGLKLNKDKCIPSYLHQLFILGTESIRIGLHPSDDKVRAVKDAPRPTNITQLNLRLTLVYSHTILNSSLIWLLLLLLSILFLDHPPIGSGLRNMRLLSDCLRAFFSPPRS